MNNHGERLEESRGCPIPLDHGNNSLRHCIVLIAQRNAFHLDTIRVWSLPLIVSVPFAGGIGYYRRAKNLLVTIGSDQNVVLQIRNYLLMVTLWTYVAVVAVLSLLDYARR